MFEIQDDAKSVYKAWCVCALTFVLPQKFKMLPDLFYWSGRVQLLLALRSLTINLLRAVLFVLNFQNSKTICKESVAPRLIFWSMFYLHKHAACWKWISLAIIFDFILDVGILLNSSPRIYVLDLSRPIIRDQFSRPRDITKIDIYKVLGALVDT